LTNIIIILEK